MPPYQFYKRGTIYHPDTGKIYVFEKNSVYVMRSWPLPRAWRKTTTLCPCWRGVSPSLSWLNTVLRHDNPAKGMTDKAWIEWYQRVPDDFRRLLEPFKRKWRLLVMLSSCGAPAKDLLISTPALAFALAENRCFQKSSVSQPWRSVRALLAQGKKQTDILRWLGFPASPSVIRIFRKYAAKDITIPGLLILRQRLHSNEWLKYFQHCRAIDSFTLYLLSGEFIDWVTPALVREFVVEWTKESSSGSRLNSCLDELRDTILMHKQCYGQNAGVPKLHSRREMRELHDLLSYGLSADLLSLTLPASPIPGNADIEPLTSLEMLLDESRKQHNCIVSYALKIADGKSYCYRMLRPERCTLEIQPSGNQWQLVQIRAVCNATPTVDAIIAAEDWLKSARLVVPKLSTLPDNYVQTELFDCICSSDNLSI